VKHFASGIVKIRIEIMKTSIIVPLELNDVPQVPHFLELVYSSLSQSPLLLESTNLFFTLYNNDLDSVPNLLEFKNTIKILEGLYPSLQIGLGDPSSKADKGPMVKSTAIHEAFKKAYVNNGKSGNLICLDFKQLGTRKVQNKPILLYKP
jgi:type IV secretory pathway VirB4 component